MKSILYIVLVLVASLAATAVDRLPDPPALNPHILDTKVAGLHQAPNGPDAQHWLYFSPFVVSTFAFRQVALIEIVQPNRSSDQIAAVMYAADPSPPASI